MRSRLLVPLVVVALVGCSRAPPTPSPEPSATSWSEPFQAHLDEYLNPAWTSLPVVAGWGCMRPEDLELEGYINGKLIVVSVDKRELMRSYGSMKPATNDPDEPGPPDWGLPWAQTPEEVGTVVLVWATPMDPTTVGGTYRDGEALVVRVVDFERKEVVSEGVVYPGFALRGLSPGERNASQWAYLTGALRSRLFAAPFQAHLPEYLDQAWLGDPSDDVDILRTVEGHIRGGLLVVSADTGELLRPSFAESLYGDNTIYGAVAPGPPDWGLRWAETPQDVGTVLLVWPRRETAGTFWDGAAGYFEFPKVKLVDLELREMIGEWWKSGEDPGITKSCDGPITGRSPWRHLMADLRSLQSSN